MEPDDDQGFEAWLTARTDSFNAEVRESIDTQAALQALKRKAAEKAQKELTEKVAVAVTTGQVPAADGREVENRWALANTDYERMRDACVEAAGFDESAVADERNRTRERAQEQCSAGAVDPLSMCRHLEAVERYHVFPDVLRRLRNACTHEQENSLWRVVSLVKPLAIRYSRAEAQVFGIPPEEVESVAQQVFFALMAELPNVVRADGKTLLSFSFTVLRREVEQVVSRALPDGAPAAAGHAGEREPMARLLGLLSDTHRQVIILRVVVGLSAVETAEAMGRTPGWVRTAQHDALVLLRRAVANTE